MLKKEFQTNMANHSLHLNDQRTFKAFAMIVDLNGFTKMVANSEDELIAQFTRDALIGGINAVEKNRGEVVAFMGDAFLALHFDADDTFLSCALIAKDVNRMNEYFDHNKEAFSFIPKGLSFKIGIEYGWIESSPIRSHFLGEQNLFIGKGINYASRILRAGEGNRCLLGPAAYEMGLNKYGRIEGPNEVKGKKGEKPYSYYQLSLGDVWIEDKSKESFH